MRNRPVGQLRLDITDLDNVRHPSRIRGMRLRFRRPVAQRKMPELLYSMPGLLLDPVSARCGLCGFRMIVHEEVGICPKCNSIICRPADDK